MDQEAFDPGTHYYSFRQRLADRKDFIQALGVAVGDTSSLNLYQWAQLMCAFWGFKPDVVLELGRGWGNSTCAFLEAIHASGSKAKLVSLCLSNDWRKHTRPKIAGMVPVGWFAPLEAHEADILTFNYAECLKGFSRVMVFWDAHGFDIAECVLGGILPLLVDRRNVILMHDLSDRRYTSPENDNYGESGLWKHNDWSGPRLKLGNIDSCVEQSVSIIDFTTRNGIPLQSADESIQRYFQSDSSRAMEMKNLLGETLFSLQAHWFWFTLKSSREGLTFPRYEPPSAGTTLPTFGERLRAAIKHVVRGVPL